MREVVAALMLAALAGCAAQPRLAPPAERQVAAAPGLARAHLVERLVALGFAVTGTERIQADNAVADPSWADCPTVVTRSSSSEGQSDFAHAEARRAVIEAATVPSSNGTSVTVGARFTATYHNRFKNLPFNSPCESTGVLETTLLDAAG